MISPAGKRTGCAALCIAALLWSAGCRRSHQPARATIRGRTWTVELAMTSEQRHLGLSGRESLDEDAGMLFMYPRPQVLDFCMRGCIISLDIAFIDSDLRIVRMYTMAVETQPARADLTYYSSETPVQYALEVAAGALARAGVSVGDKVVFSSGVPDPAKARGGP